MEDKKLEQHIKELENEILRIDLAMAANSSDYNELDKLYNRKECLSKELDAALELWMSPGR